jgi:long-subunit fatty acid transport protein
LILVLLPALAAATVPDTYGPGARLIGMGGGGVAAVEDGAAALVNPAGLYRIRRPTVAMGISGAFERFDEIPELYWDTNRDGRIDDTDAPLQYSADVDDAVGLHISAGKNVGGKFALGASAYVPTERLIRFSTFEPELPTYVMYDNRPQRYAFAVGVGGQIVKGVSVGAGVDFVPSARYTLHMTVDAELTGVEDENGEIEDMVGDIAVDVHEMDLDLVPGYAPILGVQLDLGQWAEPLKGFWLAGAYRGSVGLPIEVQIDLQANIAAEDLGSLDPFVFAVILDAGLSLFDHYVPSIATFGAAWRAEDTYTVYLDVRNTGWKRMVLNVAKLNLDSTDVTSPLVDIDDFVRDANDYEVTLRNVWSVRTGTELRLPQWKIENDLQYVRLLVRGGFQYEPSPLVSQGDSSALIDSDRMAFSAGVGAETWDPFELVNGPVRGDVFFQYHSLAAGSLRRETSTPKAGYPVSGASIPYGGHVLMVGAQWGFDY